VLFQFCIEHVQRNDIHDILLARHKDRIGFDLAHPETDEIDDWIVLALAIPGGDIAVVGGVRESVKHAQIERAGAGQLLLHDDLRRKELVAIFPVLLYQVVDLLRLVTSRIADGLDVLVEVPELDQSGMADGDFLFRHRG